MDHLSVAPLSKSVKRLLVMALCLAIWCVIIIGRLCQLQILEHDKYQNRARVQHEKVEYIAAPRGSIYDVTGTVLAMNENSQIAVVNPMRIKDMAFAAGMLAGILKENAAELQKDLEKVAQTTHHGYFEVARRLTPEQVEELKALNLDYLEIRDGTNRWYPNVSLGAHVIGNVNSEGRGQAGIEQKLDKELKGERGIERVITDVRGHGYERVVQKEPQPGKSLYLTIDARLQRVAEEALRDAVLTNHAVHGSLVAMDPYTGEIRALANYPTYNLNERPHPGETQAGIEDLAVVAPFEPGSVFKIVTLTAALETTPLNPMSMIDCGNGVIRIGKRVIHESHGGHAALTMQDVLAFSSNIGAIRIGLKVGNNGMYNYIRKFGFGHKTGIELPAEGTGRLRPVSQWQEASIGSLAMGHEITVTSVQLAQAGAIIANGGFLVKPHVVAARQAPGGPKEVVKPVPPVQVLNPETVVTMRQMMERVVVTPGGTGRRAKVVGYSTAGKTGTAQIYDFAHHLYTHTYNASFLGFLPVVNPRIVIVVTVNGTTGEAGYGGRASAPAFQRVGEYAMRVIGVPRDLPGELKESQPKSSSGDAENDLAIAGLTEPPLPEDGRASASDEADDANKDLPNPEYSGPRAPSLTGLSVKEVVQMSTEHGWIIDVLGSGQAVAQYPAPGAPLPAGEHIKVRFRPI
jgi:cell division protein FtsI (penicillin-binding protein 3)